jgi:hypothetical protein
MQFFMLNSKIKFNFLDLVKKKLEKNSEMSFVVQKLISIIDHIFIFEFE